VASARRTRHARHQTRYAESARNYVKGGAASRRRRALRWGRPPGTGTPSCERGTIAADYRDRPTWPWSALPTDQRFLGEAEPPGPIRY